MSAAGCIDLVSPFSLTDFTKSAPIQVWFGFVFFFNIDAF